MRASLPEPWHAKTRSAAPLTCGTVLAADNRWLWHHGCCSQAAQLLQIFATEDRVSQLMDVVDTVGKDEHAEIVKTWADAVAIALEQDLVVRVLNTLQVCACLTQA